MSEIPSKNYDVIVVGGGTAGVMSAIAAAKENKQVLLIEKANVLGGLATLAEVGTICGLYRNSSSEEFEFNIGRSARRFVEQLQSRCESTPQKDPTGLKYLPYQPVVLNELCIDLLNEHSIDFVLNAEITGVEENESAILSVNLLFEGKQASVKAHAYVDASGISCLSTYLNQDLIDTDFTQAASQVFSLSNVEFSSETQLSLILRIALGRGISSKVLENHQDRVYLVPGSLKNNSVSLKVTVPLPVDQTNSEQLRQSAEGMIHSILDYLKSSAKGFESVELQSIADSVGIRVVQRARGEYVLNGQDVLNCQKPENGIAYGNWPIEIWSQAQRVELRHLKENDYYSIPVASLISQNIRNLFFAGRNISADDEAMASARVIGTCLQTGIAAGMLAAAQMVETSSIEEIVDRIRTSEFN
ncbi:MAG: FAD-dependent oxidoreductase [Crocinitomicaceae bacterium]|nr:FAD-dependent oxidoreductase [Crocinitomicaceae bacterium]